MTRISVPGNKSGERGFVLLDALFCLFIAGAFLFIIQGIASSSRRIVMEAENRAFALISERNAIDYGRMGLKYDEQ
ncbi:MAG: hypothetical protein LBT16_04970 [Treponema sp.]|jgi:hypothetical protein|nr:hypothetical protein [Treponema sp.]